MTEAIGNLRVGTRITFTKTVSETDVYLFAGITGDLHPNHINEEYMKQTRYGRRIVHGALLVGFMSNCSTQATRLYDQPSVSYGYDRIRFIKPVFIGDTITVEYVITKIDKSEGKIFADVSVRNQQGEIVAVATHILKLVP
jgi:3-hydroxybutyryl-CoA dehydratase